MCREPIIAVGIPSSCLLAGRYSFWSTLSPPCVESLLLQLASRAHVYWQVGVVSYLPYWKVLYIPETLCFIPAEGSGQIKLSFKCRGFKHTLGSSRWMQRTSECTFGRCNRLRSCFVQNETTDFGICEGKLMQRTFYVMVFIEML